MNSTKPITFVTRNDLPPEVRETMVTLINQQLADILDLHSQVKQAHWNVKGMQFRELHLFFDELAASLLDYSDLLAERITALGGMALGTARISAARSRLPEFPVEIVTDKQVVEVLAQRYGDFGSSVRTAISTSADDGDQTTSDIFTEISRSIDKQLWMLEAHIQI